MPTTFVKNAPVSNTNRNCPIIFANMETSVNSSNKNFADVWHQVCQPIIDNPQAYNCTPSPIIRADIGWNWPVILKLYTFFGKTLNQKPAAYSIIFETGNGYYFPAAMLLLAKQYYYLKNNKIKASYAWFMSVAPKCVYDYYEKNNKYSISYANVPKHLGRILLDTVIVESEKEGLGGRMGLHADPAGRDELKSYYKKIPLHNIPLHNAAKRVMIAPGRINDGNYFYSDEKNSSQLTQRFMHFR